jgi:hypothetical protein
MKESLMAKIEASAKQSVSTRTDNWRPLGDLAMSHIVGNSRKAPEISSGRALSICDILVSAVPARDTLFAYL